MSATPLYLEVAPGHELYAPKGIGALHVRPGTRLDPVIHGAAAAAAGDRRRQEAPV